VHSTDSVVTGRDDTIASFPRGTLSGRKPFPLHAAGHSQSHYVGLFPPLCWKATLQCDFFLWAWLRDFSFFPLVKVKLVSFFSSNVVCCSEPQSILPGKMPSNLGADPFLSLREIRVRRGSLSYHLHAKKSGCLATRTLPTFPLL